MAQGKVKVEGNKKIDEMITVTADGRDLNVYVRCWEVKDDSMMPISININGILAITGIKVINGANGLFVGMPSYKKKDGTWEEYVFPTSKEARTSLYGQILDLADRHWEEL